MKYAHIPQLPEQTICERLEAYDVLSSLAPMLKHVCRLIDTVQLILQNPNDPTLQRTAQELLEILKTTP